MGLPVFWGMNDHFVPVGNPAPPRPRSPLAFTTSMTAAGSMSRALRSPWYPPVARYRSIPAASASPHRAVRTGSNSATRGLRGDPGQGSGHVLQLAGDAGPPGGLRHLARPDPFDHRFDPVLGHRVEEHVVHRHHRCLVARG